MTFLRPLRSHRRRRRGVTGILAACLVAALGVPGVGASAATPAGRGREVTADDPPTRRLVVGYRRGTSAERASRIEARAGATAIDALPELDARVVAVDPTEATTVAAALAAHRDVAYVEEPAIARPASAGPGRQLIPTDPLWKMMRPHDLLKAPYAWARSTGSADVVIAIIDTAFDVSHPDLAGRLLPGWDAVLGRPTSFPAPPGEFSHGTMTALVANATANNDFGIAGYCWTCRVLPIDAYDESPEGERNDGFYSDDVARAIDHAVDHDADIISMSLHGGDVGQPYPQILSDAVERAADQGILLVAAAGNKWKGGPPLGTPQWPAAHEDVIGVAGTELSDDLHAESFHGDWVNVAAPWDHPAPWPDGDVHTWGGTSTSTPAVAGILGLMRAAEPSKSSDRIRRALEASAIDIGSAVQHGRVDADAAVETVMGLGAVQRLQAAFRGGRLWARWQPPAEVGSLPVVAYQVVVTPPSGSPTAYRLAARQRSITVTAPPVKHIITVEPLTLFDGADDPGQPTSAVAMPPETSTSVIGALPPRQREPAPIQSPGTRSTAAYDRRAGGAHAAATSAPTAESPGQAGPAAPAAGVTAPSGATTPSTGATAASPGATAASPPAASVTSTSTAVTRRHAEVAGWRRPALHDSWLAPLLAARRR